MPRDAQPAQSARHIAAYSNKFSRSEVRASCSCGWIGVDQTDGEAARSDFESHLAFEGQCSACRTDIERARVLFKDAGFSDERAGTESAKVRCWEHASG